MRAARLPAASLVLAVVLPSQVSDNHSSKSPPAGAPWVTDFAQARAAAMAANKPIFVYSTKTY